jgi:CheY-like chemotaxis protein
MIVPSLVDLDASLRGLEPMLRRLIGEEVTIASDLAPGLWLTRVDPGQLEQVVINLAVNARDAMPQGGRLTIATRNRVLEADQTGRLQLEPGEYVELSVTDTGTGISPEHLEHIFEPFFTTKPQGQGTGLGLAVCYGLVKQAGGELAVETEPGRGSTFTVLLPRAAPGDVPAAPALDERLGGTETILLAEDESMVREMAARSLREVGYDVLEAEDGPSASRLAGEHTGTIHLLLTDVIMPGQSGGALAIEMRKTRPDLRVLFMSGYPDDTLVQRGVLTAEVPLLGKPFTAGGLLRAVRQVLGPDPPSSA